MPLSRRKFLEQSSLAALVSSAPMINATFFSSPAYAGSDRPMTFLSGENLTGNWDPTTHTSLAQINLESFVFGYLTRAPMTPENPDGIEFELAESMTLLDEYTLEFRLKRGIKFHNGEPFTAADVKATFEYASKPDRPAAWYPGPCDVDVVDDYTAHVKTEEYGYPASAFWFLSTFLPILSAKDVADPDVLSQRPNGTGAFRFIEQADETTVLEANAEFIGGAPKIPGVNFRFVGDADQRVQLLLDGEADIAERLSGEQAKLVETQGGFSVKRAVSVENKYLWFRCSKAPFDDPLLRRAVAHAIDRDRVLQVMGVSGTPSNAWVSPIKFGYVDTPNFPEYDPAKCQRLLSEAGFPRGQGLPTLEYFTSVGFYPKTKEYGEVITAMLREQGFDIDYQPMEIGPWAERLYDRPGGGPGHMIDCGWATGSPEPDLVLRTHFHSSSKRICGIEDAELDAVLDKERGERDPSRRRRIIQTEVMPMLADKVPALNLFTSVFIHAMRDDLRGLYIYPNGMMDAVKATNA